MVKRKDYDRLDDRSKAFLDEIGGFERRPYQYKRYVKKHGLNKYEEEFKHMEKQLQQMINSTMYTVEFELFINEDIEATEYASEEEAITETKGIIAERLKDGAIMYAQDADIRVRRSTTEEIEHQKEIDRRLEETMKKYKEIKRHQ